MATLDDILGMLKDMGLTGNESGDDLQNKVSQAAPSPTSSSDSTPITNSNPNPIGNVTPPTMPPSSFDVGVSDNTVTQNGASPAAATPTPSPTLPPLPPDTSNTILTPSVPTPTPISASKESAAKPIPPSLASSPITAPSDNDSTARQAALDAAMKRRKSDILPEVIAGAGDAIGKGLAAYGVKVPTDQQDKLMERAKANFEESKGLFEDKVQNDPNSDASKAYRQMVLQIAPDLAKQPSFQNMTAKEIGDKLPMIDTMMKAQASKDAKEMGMKQLQANKETSIGLRDDQNQEKMEQQAKQMVANLRGDKSLARAEEQRDGAISVATTVNQLQKEGRLPSKLEYYDLLGQLWKARTGATPTDAAIRDLDTKTFQGDLNKAVSYITGKPAGGTTQAVLSNIQDFADHSGKLADQFHEGYMKAHLIKPQDLEDSRWKPIAETGRGINYSDAMKLLKTQKQTPATGSTKDPMGILG